MEKKITSNKSIFLLLISLFICSVCFQNLPNNIYPNMLDLSFGFSGPDVLKTFETLGETGRTQYVYSSLILDTAFPVLYVLLFVSILFCVYSLFSQCDGRYQTEIFNSVDITEVNYSDAVSYTHLTLQTILLV